MRKTTSALLILFFVTHAKAQKIFTSDITNFWVAYDSIQRATSNQSEILDHLFLNNKSQGLSDFMQLRNFDRKDYLRVMEVYPHFWKSIRHKTLIDARKIERINKALAKFRELYPHDSKGNIYYTIGALKSGGTTSGEDLLLGIEKIVGDQHTIMTEFKDENLRKMFQFSQPSMLEQVTVHEFVHTLQKEGEINVLSKAIKEGSADFLAELTLNRKFKAHYILYGSKNYNAVQSHFVSEMFSQNFGNWFYNSEVSNNPDLGYFVGYVITKKYYQKASEKKKAIKDIIELDFDNELEVLDFLQKSNYLNDKFDSKALYSTYKLNQPKVVEIKQFKNGSQNVKSDLRQIQIVFSKPMNEQISINFSKFGKEHFPLKSVVGLDDSKTVLTVETVGLKPNTEYDFYITDRGTRSIEGVAFADKEFKVSFKTGK